MGLGLNSIIEAFYFGCLMTTVWLHRQMDLVSLVYSTLQPRLRDCTSSSSLEEESRDVLSEARAARVDIVRRWKD
jgi:hypothetical protein